eukprot:4200050-Pleurochrysis_carterae.AAC.1
MIGKHNAPDPAAAVSVTPSFSAFHTQASSVALHSAVARQIVVCADYVVPPSLDKHKLHTILFDDPAVRRQYAKKLDNKKVAVADKE